MSSAPQFVPPMSKLSLGKNVCNTKRNKSERHAGGLCALKMEIVKSMSRFQFKDRARNTKMCCLVLRDHTQSA